MTIRNLRCNGSLTVWVISMEESCDYPALALVRAEGLEPPRLSSREPKSRVSADSTTPAHGPSGNSRCRSAPLYQGPPPQARAFTHRALVHVHVPEAAKLPAHRA